MRLLARSRAPRLRGSAHALRSTYNGFTLVEPFPNGKLYFKRVVDRPLCVYVVDGSLFILSAEPLAYAIVPAGPRCFHLARGPCVLSPGDYLDDDTCLADAGWCEAKAWETFRLDAAPKVDRADLAAIARIDRLLAQPRERAAPGEDLFGLATTAPTAASATRPPNATIGPARRFNGSIDLCERARAAGWSACGLEPATVSVFVNSTRIGEARPAGERPDVAAAGYARYSAWSFAFPRPLAAGDRVAFRFPDGSPMRMARAGRRETSGIVKAEKCAVMVPV